jgi:hypothetical protein
MSRYIWTALVVLLVIGGCGRSSFVPAAGPYSGVFTVDGTGVGTLTLTATGGLLGGTGTLVHNAQTVTVSVSALVQGTAIGGTVSNASLGSGNLSGQFTSGRVALGSFDYTDIGGISTTSGSWRVEAPD